MNDFYLYSRTSSACQQLIEFQCRAKFFCQTGTIAILHSEIVRGNSDAEIDFQRFRFRSISGRWKISQMQIFLVEEGKAPRKSFTSTSCDVEKSAFDKEITKLINKIHFRGRKRGSVFTFSNLKAFARKIERNC